MKTLVELVIGILRNSPHPMTTREIAEELSQKHKITKTHKILSANLCDMFSRGVIKRGETEYHEGRATLTYFVERNATKTVTMSEHKKADEISTDKLVVDAVAKTVEAEPEPTQIYQTEAERKYFDGFSYPKDSTNSVETLIEEAKNTALLSVASVFSGLIEQIQTVDFSQKTNPDTIDALVSGLFEVSDLLSEKISVKNIIPVIEFLRCLK